MYPQRTTPRKTAQKATQQKTFFASNKPGVTLVNKTVDNKQYTFEEDYQGIF